VFFWRRSRKKNTQRINFRIGSKLSLISRFFLIFIRTTFIVPGDLAGFWRPSKAVGLIVGHTFVVNSTLDTPNLDPSTGICVDLSGKCSLRAAIMTADFVQGTDTIVLAAGVYTLTRPSYDNSALVGDLDIATDLTIQGSGSGVTIVDGNGAVTGDCVFKVLSTVQNVNFNGLTIRNGQSLASTAGVIGGGGLYMEGAGNLVLNDVIFEGNTALNGGGLYANLSNVGGSVALDRVIVRNNTVKSGGVGAGGGVYVILLASSRSLTVVDSQVDSNTADGTGGGFFVQGTDLAH
jgi:CSLREA domain-containing protein